MQVTDYFKKDPENLIKKYRRLKKLCTRLLSSEFICANDLTLYYTSELNKYIECREQHPKLNFWLEDVSKHYNELKAKIIAERVFLQDIYDSCQTSSLSDESIDHVKTLANYATKAIGILEDNLTEMKMELQELLPEQGPGLFVI